MGRPDSGPNSDTPEYRQAQSDYARACEIDDGNCCAGSKLPPTMTVETFWRLLDLAPNDPLSTHLVRLFALHLGKLTDIDKLDIIAVFTGRLGIKAEYLEKLPGIGIANRKDLEA